MLDSSSLYVRNDRDKRTLVFENAKHDGVCRFRLEPVRRLVRNPAFQIQNWGSDEKITVRLNGAETVYRSAMEKSSLLVWVKAEISDVTTIDIHQIRK